MASIGIDFGTTNSSAAVFQSGLVSMVPSAFGKSIIPSLVSIREDGEVFIGHEARERSVPGKSVFIFSIKKDLGTFRKIGAFGRFYTPVEIASLILRHIKHRTEKYLGGEVKSAVLSSPAYFSINQRMALKEACRLSGLEVREIINEPNAAALSYGMAGGGDRNFLVYDLGGGTCDISLIRSEGGSFRVLALAGDNNLGGDNFDYEIMNLMIRKAAGRFQPELLNDPFRLFLLKQEAEKAKIRLSRENSASLPLDSVFSGSAGGQGLEMDRPSFEALIRPYLAKSLELVRQVLLHARLSVKEIGQVLLVGGSTRIPLIRQGLSGFFQRDLDTGVNADECVSRGAAIHCRHLDEKKNAVLLKDVIPLSLGVEVEGGIFIPMIKKNSVLPVSCQRIFTPLSTRQKNIEIRIFQGERIRARDNIPLGRITLKNVQSAAAGELPKIEVDFRVDGNGLIEVKARDTGTGKETEARLTSAYHAPGPETEGLIRKAGKFEKSDLEFFYRERTRSAALELLGKYRELRKKGPVPADLKKFMESIRNFLKKKDFDALGQILKFPLETGLFSRESP